MNRVQKIILSVYVLVVFAVWLKIFLEEALEGICSNKTAIVSCAVDYLVIIPILLIIVFGIPTFILWKIWGRRNKERDQG